MIRTDIIVLNWNGWKDTLDLLHSLTKFRYSDLDVRIIVIDNASTDESFDKLRGWAVNQKQPWLVKGPDVSRSDLLDQSFLNELSTIKWQGIVVGLNKNIGFCGGNNLGMEIAFRTGAKYALILNNDTLVEEGFLYPMVQYGESHPDAGLIGGTITYCSHKDQIWWAGGSFNMFLDTKRILDRQPLSNLGHADPYDTDWISGCMMLVKREVYERIGGFYEPFFIWAEEWDYSLRARKAGFRCTVVPKARICHKVGQTLGVMSPLSYYYGIRNAILLKRMHLPSWKYYLYLALYLPNRLVRYTQFLLQGRKDLAWSGVWALLDGIRGKEGKWKHHDRASEN